MWQLHINKGKTKYLKAFTAQLPLQVALLTSFSAVAVQLLPFMLWKHNPTAILPLEVPNRNSPVNAGQQAQQMHWLEWVGWGAGVGGYFYPLGACGEGSWDFSL